MPQMGESIAEGTITKWLKNVGDHVERDEPLFEISTDKVDAEIPSPAAGILTDIKFKEGDTVEINTVVAVLDGEGAQPSVDTAAARDEETPAEAEPRQAEAKPAEPTRAPAAETPKPAPPPTAPAPQAPVASTHKTEVKPLVRKSDAGSAKPATSDNGGATAEELRRTKSSPLVRKIAEEHGIDIKQLEGTGMSGRVTKNDILSFIESGATPQRATAAP
jgi:2-oxoglutarate dehydrogenase E2 component (dihydrolipoamide succinyltransferase)